MTFLNNKYTNRYFWIIDRARSEKREKTNSSYFELHHIIPRCMGGNNSEDNLVLLTAREHFLCHVLLTKMVPIESEARTRLLYAVLWFKRDGLSSRLYEIARIEVSKIRKGRPTSNDATTELERRKKISNALKERWKNDEYKSKHNKPDWLNTPEVREKSLATRRHNYSLKEKKPPIVKYLTIYHPTKGFKQVKNTAVPTYRRCGWERIDRLIGMEGLEPSGEP